MFDTHIRTLCLVMMIAYVWCACSVDIFKAVEKGDAEEVARMLQEKPEEIRATKGDNKESLLHKASRHGHVAVVRLLLSRGADVNAYDSSRETPLLKAIRNYKMVVLLVQDGADVNVRWFDSAQLHTPLVQAIYLRKRAIVKFLICHGAMVFYEWFNFRSLVLEKRLQSYFPGFDWRADKAQFIKARIDYFMDQFGLPEVIARLILEIEGIVPLRASECDESSSDVSM